MTSEDEQVRARVAEKASEWFVANDEAPLSLQQSAALVAWLRASPLHVEEFLGVAAVARDLHAVGTDPECSVDLLLARAQADEQHPVQSLGSRAFAALRDGPLLRWQRAMIVATAAGVAGLGLWLWNLKPTERVAASDETTAQHFQTRHGEQRSYRLADNSLLHLNTDSAVTVRYAPHERLIVLSSGEADFEVNHEPKRAFRVLAGPAAVVDVGTKFDVRLQPGSALVTVIEGRVAVEPSTKTGKDGAGARPDYPARSVEVVANQQVSVAEGEWPGRPITVDAERATAWLHRQIAFDHEPLGRVAAEFNRYVTKPIEITAPGLAELEVSGVFSTDDPEEFLAFLRSLEGVRVEVTPTRIRVSQK
ncbi:MAG TPA: FecR domain-containing protein [Candidatus Margulisiibacteriota bacterium]|nr:FecR domain-containing protein [Candidatus Margulisiibacteriota bacterium]